MAFWQAVATCVEHSGVEGLSMLISQRCNHEQLGDLKHSKQSSFCWPSRTVLPAF